MTHRINRITRLLLAAVLAQHLMAAPAAAAVSGVPVIEGFADLADLTLAAPVVLHGTVVSAKRLSRKAAPDVPPGQARFLVETAVTGVLVSPAAVPARIAYLWDAALDARGRAPKLKRAAVLLFLRPVTGKPAQYQLVSSAGQLALTATTESKVRQIIAQARAPEIRDLRVTGVANAFHVPGSIPGEAETQIFLQTANGRPMSLVVLSRPGQAKSLQVATGEVIDEAATGVPRDSMLWYRLACALPPALPEAAVAELPETERSAAQADYRFVVETLGSCGRTLK